MLNTDQTRYIYRCRGCGHMAPRDWGAFCPNCGSPWTSKFKRLDPEDDGRSIAQIDDGERVSSTEVPAQENRRIQIGTPYGPVDDLLGGGIVTEAVILLSGEPGAGKSTLCHYLEERLARNLRVLLVNGEQSIKQTIIRYDQCGLPRRPKLEMTREENLEEILYHVEDSRARVVIIDSIQKVKCWSPDTGEEMIPGTVKSIKTAIDGIMKYAQKNQVAFIVLGHVSQDGTIAGPKSFQHDVDVVLFLRRQPEGKRVLENHKNRFGSTGTLQMTMSESGLALDAESLLLFDKSQSPSPCAGTGAKKTSAP